MDAPVRRPPLEILGTPGTPTIDTLAEFLGVPASATLKNLLVTTESGDIVAVGVPGDRDIDLDRLSTVLGPVQIFEDFAGRPDLVKGYVGPQGLPADVRYLADPRIAPGTVWVTGVNEVDRHARGVVCGRDFAVPTTRRWPPSAPGTRAPGAARGCPPTGRSRSGTSSGSAVSLRRLRSGRARPRRQARAGDDGVVRHRSLTGGRGPGRADP